MNNMIKATVTISASLLMAFVLFACSSDTKAPPPDPLAAYKSQIVNWHKCDPGILGDNPGLYKTLSVAQKGLGERLKCASITVPLDYENPSRGDLKIAVMRTAAGDPNLRKGAIFFNPGGPGADGLYFAASYGELWNKQNPTSEIDVELKQVSDHYDLIGFSPRGVGASTQLICASNEQALPTNNDRSGPTIQNMLYNARLVAEACLKNPITRYINTDQTARDMDLIRHLLGDQKLNYIGYSYGTWLGAWYASLFPERVGRMLLDSSMDISGTMSDAELADAEAHQLALDELLTPYAMENKVKFNLDYEDNYLSYGIFTELGHTRDWVVSYMIDTFTLSGKMDDMLYRLSTGKALQDLIMKSQGDFSVLAGLVDQASFLPDEEQNKKAREEAAEFIDELLNSDPDVPESLKLGNDDSVGHAVRCNDTPLVGDETYWIYIGDQWFFDYPFFGGGITSNPCIYWGGPSTIKPDIAHANNTSEGILFLQSSHDTRTPAKGAQKGFSKISNASMIMVENEHAHGLFPYETECVDLKVLRYFNEGILPDRESSCNVKSSVVSSKAGTVQKAAITTDKPYEISERDRELIDMIKSTIR